MTSIEKYDQYTVKDFVWDEQFREWVLYPDSYLAEYWTNWLQRYPEKEAILQQAKEVVLALTVRMEKLSDQKKEEIISKTLKELNIPILHSSPLIPNYAVQPHKRNYLRYSLGIAAAFLLVLAGTWLIVNKKVDRNTDYTYKMLIKRSKTALVETKNTFAIPLSVQLSDGSTVKLERDASISYPPSFNSLDKREVYLSGDAFFEITKNPLKPFFVHVNGIVTKVLGTSFKVKTDNVRNGVTVEVVTGRVEVYEQEFSALHSGSKKGNGVILTPNQKVVYTGEKNLFESSLVDEPVPIIKANKKIAKEDFVFEDAPLYRVLDAIENIYGIKVEVENEAILNCLFTGDIAEQNLYRKFDAICQSTKTTYEIKETKVFIKGQGCY